ncbi:MAG: PilZ domain-containing protein, partial [Gammaproteobacteria bacterium]|nr:PilZ domain-containing protein [Gammaproteobacteria bacterium]
PVSLSNPVRVVLSDNASLITNGELRDLSVGGFSARMKLDDIEYSVGDVVPKCMLHMPADKKIFCSAEIRQIDPAEGNRLPRIGARFVDMGKADLKQIEKFVAEVDRELVRRFRQ